MRWYVVHRGREFGPFTPDKLRDLVASLKLRADQTVRPEDSQHSYKAWQLKGLFPKATFADGQFPVDMETGFQPAPLGSFRPADGYLAGCRRLAASRYGVGLAAIIVLGCLFAYRHHHEREPASSDIPTGKADDHAYHATDLQERVGQWKARREKLVAVLSGLERDRVRLVERLKNFGVVSPDDIPANPRAKVLAKELREVLRQKGTYQRQLNQYELAILKAESCLRAVERQRAASEAGVGDKELDDLVRSVLVLDEKLAARGHVPLELDDDLSKQFEKRKAR